VGYHTDFKMHATCPVRLFFFDVTFGLYVLYSQFRQFRVIRDFYVKKVGVNIRFIRMLELSVLLVPPLSLPRTSGTDCIRHFGFEFECFQFSVCRCLRCAGVWICSVCTLMKIPPLYLISNLRERAKVKLIELEGL